MLAVNASILLHILVLPLLSGAKDLLWDVEISLVDDMHKLPDRKHFSLYVDDVFVDKFREFASTMDLSITSQKDLLGHTIEGVIELYDIPILFGNSRVDEWANFNELLIAECRARLIFGEACDNWAVSILLRVLDHINAYVIDGYEYGEITDSPLTTAWMTDRRLMHIQGPSVSLIQTSTPGADILFLLRPFAPLTALVLDIGSGIGLRALHLSDINPDGSSVLFSSRNDEEQDYLNSNAQHIVTTGNVMICTSILPEEFVLRECYSPTPHPHTERPAPFGVDLQRNEWTIVSVDLSALTAAERAIVLQPSFMKALCSSRRPLRCPIMLLSLFGERISLQDSLSALDKLSQVLEDLKYKVYNLPYHKDVDFLCIPPALQAAYDNVYGAFIFHNGESAGGNDVWMFPGQFLRRKPICVSPSSSANGGDIWSFICTSVMDCDEALRRRYAALGENRMVLVLSNCLSERGTGWQTLDYVRYAEDLLGMRGRFYFLYPLDGEEHSVDMANKIKHIFGTNHVFEVTRTDDLLPAVDRLVQLGITHIYYLSHGWNECPPKNPAFAKVLLHCVFEAVTPCGDVYARVSPSVPVLDTYRSHVPIVPPIVHWDSSLSTGNSMRGELGISEDALVFCRHGGKDSFNIPFVIEVVLEVARSHPHIIFLFMNTRKFSVNNSAVASSSNIIFLPVSVDEEAKLKFIRSCDAMLHASDIGETFGIAIAEFSVLNVPVITSSSHTNNGRAKTHLDLLHDRGAYYRDRDSLRDILLNFRSVYWKRNATAARREWNSYRQFRPLNVIRKFEEVFFNSLLLANTSFVDLL